MDEARARLTKCFAVVFSDLNEEQIAAASQATLPEWDSIAAITMLNVLEDEFGFPIDLDDVADLDSFERILLYIAPRVSA
jgi:acyl carrier protein